MIIYRTSHIIWKICFYAIDIDLVLIVPLAVLKDFLNSPGRRKLKNKVLIILR
jgi:hypothetical protein